MRVRLSTSDAEAPAAAAATPGLPAGPLAAEPGINRGLDERGLDEADGRRGVRGEAAADTDTTERGDDAASVIADANARGD